MTTTRQTTRVRRLAALAVAALAFALGLGAGAATPAGAHDGDAVIAVEAAHPAGTGVHYIVRVTWQDDGHAAADATVTATAVAGDGTQLTPVTLAPADSDGRYAGVVDFPEPGAWTVRITSIDPTGTLEQPQEVAPPPTTAPSDGGSEVTTGPGDADAGNGFAPAEDGTGASDEQARTSQSGSAGGDDGGMPIYLALAAAVVVIVGAATAVNIVRRNRPDLAGGEGAGSTASDGPRTGDGPSRSGTPDDGTPGDGTPGHGTPGVDRPGSDAGAVGTGQGRTDGGAPDDPAPTSTAGAAGGAPDDPSTLA